MRHNKSWKELEEEYNEKWLEYHKNILITWLSRDKFWELYETTYESPKRYLDHEILFPASMQELRSKIRLQAPVYMPFDEDFPGPVERWYGSMDSNLFVVTHFYHPVHHKNTLINCENRPEIVNKIKHQMDELMSIIVPRCSY